MGVDPTSSEAPLSGKHKGKELTAGTSKRSRKKAGEISSAFLPSSGVNIKLWKHEFSACELGR